MKELLVRLDASAGKALYEQIYEYIRGEIMDGRLSRGERLPSARLLAQSLQVSRSTADAAYAQLASEGYLSARRGSGHYVFVSEKKNYAGRQMTYHSAYGIMKRVQEPLNLEFTFHDLRHSFCTRLIEQGVDIGIVQLVMGHERLYTTRRYLHMSDSYLMECMSRYWAVQEGGNAYE